MTGNDAAMRKKLTGILLFLLLLAGCEKDFDVFIPDATSPVQVKTVDQFFEAAGPEVQQFEINADSGGTVVLASRGTLAIPPQALLDATGNPVSGTVRLTVREADSRGDWLRAHLSSVYEDGFLEIAAAIEVNFYRGEERLSVAGGQSFTAAIPVLDSLEAPALFWSQPDGGGPLGWSAVQPTNPLSYWQVFNEATETWLPAIRFAGAATGWLLAGQPAAPAEKTDICIVLPEGHDEDNTVAFAVYRDQPIIVPLLRDTAAADVRFCGDQLPAGTPLSLIVIRATAAGAFFFQQQDLTPPPGVQLEWMTPEPLPLPEIIERLEAL